LKEAQSTSRISMITRFENQRISRIEAISNSPANFDIEKTLEELPRPREFSDQLTKFKIVAFKKGNKRRVK